MIRLTTNQQGFYHVKDIEHRFPEKIPYFMKIGNKFIAILSDTEISNHQFNVVYYTETHKTPIYKQALQMQMGRIPKTHTEETRRYRPILLSKQQAIPYRFEIYKYTTF